VEKTLLLPRIPVSTYRLQFNSQFRFSDARKIIYYLHLIGITDIYSSPYFKARKGSIHGYDIVDPAVLNPEIGTDEEYNELIRELRKYGMGQILDIVPNHMCIESKDNTWWMDVLENGQGSFFADFFDIDWEPEKKELKGRILIPILGDQYGNVLERQELSLVFEEGMFYVFYFDNKFPVLPNTYIHILKHRFDSLQKHIPADNPHYKELVSIITVLDNLPGYSEKDTGIIRKKWPEKGIIKKRLSKLCYDNPVIKTFIAENVLIFNGTKGDPASFDLLDKLLDMQVYRLSYWRVAAEEINYRRFFDINSLASIRMENPIVFSKTHEKIFELIKGEKVTGLRVDHPDGLYNPSEYFQSLQQSCFVQKRLAFMERVKDDIPSNYEQSNNESAQLKQYDEILLSEGQYKPFYIIAEKILSKGEKMPEEWPIFSTTGYVFLNALNGIFVETKNAKAFEDIYARFIKSKINLQDIVYEKKKLIMQVAMSSEINTLGRHLNTISEKNRHTRDFTLNNLTDALIDVIAFFPVYRTYINTYKVKERDRQYIELAVSKAKRKNPVISESVFDFICDVFLLRFPEEFVEEDKKTWLDFVMRFQQITGSVMAKGFEDTAFYVYNRLVSLNEVGGMPDRFGTPLETFHGQNIERVKFWPDALIASTTHDSKRSEDVRARINVLSEIPEEWKRNLAHWSRLNKKRKVVVDGLLVPDRNEEYLIYQILIGAWPLGTINESEYDFFKSRIKNYMRKAVREAKVNTSWINPNAIYEEAVMHFIDTLLDKNRKNNFLEVFVIFQKMVSDYGMLNSLSQVLLKITSPGIPDFYQGAEIWDFSLVDPDNRRPVNYGLRITMLEDLKKREKMIGQIKLSRDLTVDKESGMVKLYIIYKSLNYRKANRQLFERGEYIPLEVYGERAGNVCAFARRSADKRIIVAVPRFLAKPVPQSGGIPLGEEVWKDSFIVIPFAEAGAKYRNIFTDEILTAKNHTEATALQLSEIFANSPVALLESLPKQRN
jgi:(1->4)-alpha-D-glucan 1-alpha-D-glucosylmutase